MYIISGCPRSGTSLMMDLMRESFGDERILGKKFPSEKNNIPKTKHETDAQYNARVYVDEHIKSKRSDSLGNSKDMNPNGFWEMEYTVKGVKYDFNDRNRLEELKVESPKSFCKIVSQGLSQSDPTYIDKIIYMIRHPREVAKSQERLIRSGPINGDNAPMVNGKAVKIHTPEMYIQVTTSASQWLLSYPEIPVLFVHYNDLIENATEVLSQIEDFLGEDILDKPKVSQVIDSSLRRSQPEDIESDLWIVSEKVYELFCSKQYQELLTYMAEQDIEMRKKNRKLFCMRTESVVGNNICSLCISKTNPYSKNQIPVSESKGIDWRSKPCIYECGFREGFEPLTIQESIDNNFWIDEVEPKIKVIDVECDETS